MKVRRPFPWLCLCLFGLAGTVGAKTDGWLDKVPTEVKVIVRVDCTALRASPIYEPATTKYQSHMADAEAFLEKLGFRLDDLHTIWLCGEQIHEGFVVVSGRFSISDIRSRITLIRGAVLEEHDDYPVFVSYRPHAQMPEQAIVILDNRRLLMGTRRSVERVLTKDNKGKHHPPEMRAFRDLREADGELRGALLTTDLPFIPDDYKKYAEALKTFFINARFIDGETELSSHLVAQSAEQADALAAIVRAVIPYQLAVFKTQKAPQTEPTEEEAQNNQFAEAMSEYTNRLKVVQEEDVVKVKMTFSWRELEHITLEQLFKPWLK